MVKTLSNLFTVLRWQCLFFNLSKHSIIQKETILTQGANYKHAARRDLRELL